MIFSYDLRWAYSQEGVNQHPTSTSFSIHFHQRIQK